MKPFVFFLSSLTGNTKKICLPVFEEALLLQPESRLYDTASLKTLPELPADARIVLCFWCRKGSLDYASRRLLSELAGKEILVFGTFGGNPNSSYADLVRKNVSEAVNEHNRCLGVFLSQGKINPARTEKRLLLPEDHPHHLIEEGYRRHLESRKHPDKTDIANAVSFFRTMF